LGYSKDHKFNQGQILPASMVTNEGLPVGYEVFPGNMFEGDTFKTAIDRIKVRYAEAIKYIDYIRLDSESACKEIGKMNIEGKEYVVKDVNIRHFRFNL